MLLKSITNKEFYNNGNLFFTEITSEIEPMFLDSFKNSPQFRTEKNGKKVNPYIVLMREKHFKNGQFAWCLEWGENGILINKNNLSYREDGSLIQY